MRATTKRSGNVVERIRDYNASREPERLSLKYEAMCADSFAFLRGTAHLYAEDWAADGDAALNAVPQAWSCSDLHMENFGSFRGNNDLAYFDVNDFDQADMAPATYDVARFLVSVVVAGRKLQIEDAEVTCLMKQFLDSYRMSLRAAKPYWVERDTAEGAVRTLLRRAHRSAKKLVADQLADDEKDHLDIGKHKLLAATPEDKRMVTRAVEAFGAESGRPEFFTVLDVARRAAGLGSLGTQRFAVLVRGDDSTARLIDMKAVGPSALSAYGISTLDHEWPSAAHRVTAVQHAAQAVPPALLAPLTCRNISYVVRELQPSEDRLALDELAHRHKRMMHAVETMGCVTAWMQLRTAGRWDAAEVDELAAWSDEPAWARAVMLHARMYAARVERNWNAFRRGWKSGAIR